MAEEQAAAANMGCSAGDHVILVDTTELKLQSQEIFSACQQFIDSAPRKARKIALVVGQSVSRMQARRLMSSKRLGTFGSTAEAMDWLLERGQTLEAASA